MSILSRLRTMWFLPAPERILALRAVGALVRARVDTWWMSLPRLRRSLGTHAAGRPERSRALAVKRAVARAARSVPMSTCLVQAIAALRMLRAEGLPGELTIGVAPTGSGVLERIDAHAWVVSGDVVVAGEGDLVAYTELTRIGART